MTTTIDGTFNFRDTGGMPLIAGGLSTPGVLYRSDAFSGLTPEGLEQLAATDIGVVVDFRTPTERQMAPDRLPVSRPFVSVELPLLEGAITGLAQQGQQSLAQGSDTEAAAQAMAAILAQLPSLGDLYVGMLEHGATSFAEFARYVSAATVDPPTAVVVHCTAGKDRTGVSTALVLDAAGVTRAAIVADYAASQDNLAGPWADRMYAMVEKFGVPLNDALRELVAGTPPEAIEKALAWVDAQGGSAAYLQSGGLTDDELAALRAKIAG